MRLVLAVVVAVVALGAKPSVSDPACWWDPATITAGEASTLHAVNLPPEWSATFEPYPIGVSARPDTFSGTFNRTGDTTAYFWTRGGPYEALFKPGKQLNDYKPVAMCSLDVEE